MQNILSLLLVVVLIFVSGCAAKPRASTPIKTPSLPIEVLSAPNSDPTAISGAETLLAATLNDDTETLKKLLKEGADPNIPITKSGNTILGRCFWPKTPCSDEAIRILLDGGADPRKIKYDKRKFSWSKEHALFAAATRDQFSVFEMLVEKTPGGVDRYGYLERTPLSQAAFYGHKASISKLIELGADLTKVGSQGKRMSLEELYRKGVAAHKRLEAGARGEKVMTFSERAKAARLKKQRASEKRRDNEGGSDFFGKMLALSGIAAAAGSSGLSSADALTAVAPMIQSIVTDEPVSTIQANPSATNNPYTLSAQEKQFFNAVGENSQRIGAAQAPIKVMQEEARVSLNQKGGASNKGWIDTGKKEKDRVLCFPMHSYPDRYFYGSDDDYRKGIEKFNAELAGLLKSQHESCHAKYLEEARCGKANTCPKSKPGKGTLK